MNSTKLFNFKFFSENIKKSRAIIALLCVVLPMFTILQIINSNPTTFFDYATLAGFNIFFMYIIPVILSITLFNYLYKKSSVDFMMSKPISRKSMFLTNLIGGSIILILIQFINFILQSIALQLSGIAYFQSMIWDIFVYQTVGYLFVYVVSTLAMSVSGNKMTQIVVTLIIIFIIPVAWLTIIDSSFTGLKVEDYICTAPVQIINEYQYEEASILKMLVLIVIYTIIAYIMFNRKKFESAGESFLNEKTHIIVKALTLLPFAILFVEEDGFFDEWWLIVAIALIYWFVYDLITNKKIKFLKNIIYFVTSFVLILIVLFGCTEVVEKFFPYYRDSEKIESKQYYKISDNAKLLIGEEIASEEQKREILHELKYKEYKYAYEKSFYGDDGFLNVVAYDYQNHKLIRFGWEISKDSYLALKLVDMYKETFKSNLETLKEMNSQLDLDIFEHGQESRYGYYKTIYDDYTLNDLYKFIEENIDDKVDLDKAYMIISDHYKGMYFITNKTEEIKNIVEKYEEDEEQKYYINDMEIEPNSVDTGASF